MSEPVLKQRSTVDLDDFERRLRQAASASAHREDPLAELARLVGEPHDPFNDVFAMQAPLPPGAPHHADMNYAGGHHADGSAVGEPGFAPDVPRLFGDFSAIEAGLRGARQGHPAQQNGYDTLGRAEAGYVQAGQLPLDNEGEWAGIPAADAYTGSHSPVERAAPRSRRPATLMAASIAIGVLGIGAAFALKGRVASSPREVKTIMADATPTKIQPPPESSGDAATDSFGKGNATQPTRLVSREEQPVDIGQAVQDNVARAAQSKTDAASVPVPPSPGQMQGRADPIAAQLGSQAQGFGLAEMPAPKRVKVVAVRPDGSIVPGDETAPHASADAARTATPKSNPGKTTSRVAARSADDSPGEKTIDQIAAGADDAAKPTRRSKSERVASAAADEAVAAPASEPAGEGGNFAVQLAAPSSESDAKAASSRLSKKFSDALGSRRIAVRKAESNGKSVYRVRVSSLSRSEATNLCDKLKADGGSCFVAKN